MLQVKDFPIKKCLFCHNRMSFNLNMNILSHFEPPDKVISSGGLPIITYICPSCGFVACFEESIMKKIVVKIP
jgi:hypothetical protein